MAYYKMLAVVFAILILSVIVQGRELFSDAFFVVAYTIMGAVLFIGTKYKKNSTTALSMGFILILSVGFLSTFVLVEFFTSVPTVTTFFKLAIAFSLDGCALFFLRYGRNLRKEESLKHGLGQYEFYKEQHPE